MSENDEQQTQDTVSAPAVDTSDIVEQVLEELVTDEDGKSITELLSEVKEQLQDDPHELKPITPKEARDSYLTEREEDASYDTLDTISDSTALFVEWAEDAGIENLNTVGGRELQEFKDWCKEESDNNTVSLNGILSNVRRFLVYCVRIEAVASDVPEKTPVPNVPDDEDVCYEKPSDEEVEQTLAHLRQYEHASRRHVEYEIVQEFGCRMGAARAIDFDEDVDIDEQVIHLRYRPEKSHPDERGTPLKNQKDGERNLNISDHLAELIQDHLDNPERDDVEDKFNREPLFTTEDGRITLGTFRRDFYKLTRPCEYSDSCPHERDEETCEAANNEYASKCPSSYSPHPLRRWSIENQIDRGVPKELLSDRVDVSVPVLNEHYDTRSKERKRKHRLKLLEKIYPDIGDPEATIQDDTLEDTIESELKSTLEPDLDELPDDVADLPTSDEIETDGDAGDDNPESDGDEEISDDSQVTFDRFGGGITGVTTLGAWPVIVTIIVGRWLQRRVNRELTAMTPEAELSATPGYSRAAKGLTEYCIFVGLLSLNFALLGVPSVAFF